LSIDQQENCDFAIELETYFSGQGNPLSL